MVWVCMSNICIKCGCNEFLIKKCVLSGAMHDTNIVDNDINSQLRQAIIIVFIPRHMIVAGYYGFTLDVRVYVCTSVRPFFVSG